MALPWNSLLHTQNFAGYLTRAAMPPTTASSIETPSDADCTGHVVPGARRCALGTFSYLVTSTSYFCLSYPSRGSIPVGHLHATST